MEINLMDYVSPSMMILVVVVYIMGMFFKNLESLKDKYITMALMGTSIIFGIALDITTNGASANTILDGIIQGIVCWGVSIGINQTIKQIKKDE